ncbi:MAG: tetratricopeptide repeat protein, partial [Lysobacteraceae bacterium]
ALYAAPTKVQIESLLLRGDALRQLGKPAQCRDLLSAHLVELDSKGNDEKRMAAEYQSVLGRCERGLQHTDAARAHFKSALALRESLGDAATGEAESLVDLASLESDTGHNQAALAGMLDAQQRLRAAHNEQGPLAISIWLNLGNLYREFGNGAAAETAYRTGYRLSSNLYGDGHPTTIDAERGLAAIYVDQGKLDQAEALFSKAQEQLVRLLGPEHPDLGSMSNSLGIIAWERGDAVLAETRLRRAIALWAPSPRLHGGLFNLAMVLHSEGKNAEAESLAQRALSLRIQRFGANNGLVGMSLGQLGDIKLSERDLPAADRYLSQALEILKGNFGIAHTATGKAQLSLARLRLAQQRPADAQALIDDLEHRFKPSDAEHRRLLWATQTLAAQMQCGQPDHAEQARRELARIRDAVVAELPVSVIARDTNAALDACGK